MYTSRTMTGLRRNLHLYPKRECWRGIGASSFLGTGREAVSANVPTGTILVSFEERKALLLYSEMNKSDTTVKQSLWKMFDGKWGQATYFPDPHWNYDVSHTHTTFYETLIG